MKRKKIGIVFGPNGAGKGTLVERLSKEFDYTCFNMGQSIRDWLRIDREARRKYLKLINAGNLIDDVAVWMVVDNYFKSLKERYGNDLPSIIFDGLPRRESQVRFIQSICDIYEYEVEWLIVLSISLEEVMDRVSQRVVAPDGTVYHYKYNPPPSNVDPSNLKHRKDDRPHIVRKRYEELMINSLECLGDPYFKDVPVANIDASNSIEEVHREAASFIKHYKEL